MTAEIVPRPSDGYDKNTVAADFRRLLHQHLDSRQPVTIVGHDIGLMIAYAYAQAYRSELSHLVIIDAPLPGTAVFDRLRSNPRLWHFAFHSAADKHLGLGLADLVIGRLSNVRHLVVRPTSAVLDFGGRHVNSLNAGRDLKVDVVLEGSVRTTADRV